MCVTRASFPQLDETYGAQQAGTMLETPLKNLGHAPVMMEPTRSLHSRVIPGTRVSMTGCFCSLYKAHPHPGFGITAPK